MWFGTTLTQAVFILTLMRNSGTNVDVGIYYLKIIYGSIPKSRLVRTTAHTLYRPIGSVCLVGKSPAEVLAKRRHCLESLR